VNLSYTDYRIVQALHDDSRKALADVAEDLGLSPKTVRRRLDAMVANGAVLQTLALLPETSNDLIAIFRISLKRGVGPMQAYPRLVNRYGPRLLSIKPFTNLSNIVLCTIWCRTMTEVKELHRSIEQEPSVESAVLNIVYDTRVFETWIDRVLIDMATSPDPKLSVGKGGRRGQGKGKGESREQRRKRRLSIRTIAELEAYRKALVQALADGVITSDEDAILRSLRDTLKISEAEHTAIFKMICSDLQKSPKEIEAYRQALAQALEDGVITDDEEAILMTLRDSLKISDEDHKRLLDVMSVKRKGKRGSG
jgi:DNA-binding Lrp family transcriptional regulator